MGKPSDLSIVSTDDALLGTTPTTTGAVETTIHGYGSGPETGPRSTAGQSAGTMRELPDHDIRTILQPLPPGWVQGQGFAEGLHPTTDVFDQEEEQHDGSPQRRACENGEAAGPEIGEVSPCDNGAGSLPQNLQEGTHPDAPDSDDSSSACDEQVAMQAEGEEQGDTPRDNGGHSGIPEPAGEPFKLTAQQRARLHELLRTRDPGGGLPYGLDRCTTDEGMWQAYRKGMKESYRALRKRKRADGTWRIDDNRGWGPVQRSDGPSREREPLPRRRERSPLPRRRAASSSTGVTPEQL